MREAQRVDISKSGSEIADHIRRKVIYEGLELEEIGIDLADITDDVPLFGEDGLDLDSIDALEILAGVQREFGLSLTDVDQAFMDEHCATVGRLASMVASMSPDNVAPRQTSDRVVRGQAPDTGDRAKTPGEPETPPETPDEAVAAPFPDATDVEPETGSSANS